MAKKKRKLIIVTAPSGAGKTTIVRHILKKFENISFSISATNRARRPKEIEGKDYYYFSTEKFNKLIKEKAFIEFEEVYENQFYGTLQSEVERIWAEGKHIIFDVDVRGATSIKKIYPNSLAIFIKPPSIVDLFNRLTNRKTETTDSIKKRIKRAKQELVFENSFDTVLVNDQLEKALSDAELIIADYIFP